MNTCDKCGKIVTKKESALWLAIAGGMHPIALLVHTDRHIICSPSRAQFIIGLDVVDDRPEYDKRLMSIPDRVKSENFWTNAYNKLQEEKE